MPDLTTVFDVLQQYGLAILLSISVFWLSLTLIDLLMGGALLAILIAYIRLPLALLLRIPVKPPSPKFGLAFNFIVPVLFFSLAIQGFISGFVDSRFILDALTSPIFIIFWAISSIGLSLQAGVPAKTGLSQSSGAGVSAFFISVPAFIVCLYITDSARELYVYWAFIFGSVLGALMGVFTNLVIIPKRYLEMSLLERDSDISKRLEPLAKVLAIIRSFPKFVRSRREITYLMELREASRQALRSGRYDEAQRNYEIFDYEFPRVSSRLDAKIRADFKREIDEQIHDLKMRATRLSSKREDGNLKEAISSVVADIEALGDDIDLSEEWNFESVFQGRADSFSNVVARLDRLAALAEAIDVETIMSAWEFDAEAVQETICIADVLGVDAAPLKNILEKFRTATSAIQRLEFESYAELQSAMDSSVELVKESDIELKKLSNSLAARYNFENYVDNIVVIFPRHIKKDEEGKILILYRGPANENTVKEIEVSHTSSGISFLEGNRFIIVEGGEAALIETIFRSTSSKKNSFRTSLSFGNLSDSRQSFVQSVYVVPPMLELISEAGAIGAAVTAFAALLLYGLGVVSNLTIEQSTIGFVSALCGCVYLAYSAVRIRIERNSLSGGSS